VYVQLCPKLGCLPAQYINVFAQPLSILWAAEVMCELKTRGNVRAGDIGEKAEAWQHNLQCFFKVPGLKKKKKTFMDAQERRSASVFLRALHNMLLTGSGMKLLDFAGQQSEPTPAPSAASQGPRAAAQDPEPADTEMPVLGSGKPDEEMLVLDGSKTDDEMPVLPGDEVDSESDDEIPVLIPAWGESESESEDEKPVPEEESNDVEAASTAEEAPHVRPEKAESEDKKPVPEEESNDVVAASKAEEAPRVRPEKAHSFWHLGPFKAADTMGDVKDLLKAWGWDAKPLQQTGPLHWMIEAVSDPPFRRFTSWNKIEKLTVCEHVNLEDASGDGKREANIPMSATCPSAPEMIIVMDEGSINFSAMWYLLFEKKFRIMVLRDPCHRSQGIALAKHIV
jgi:hypothetical protein